MWGNGFCRPRNSEAGITGVVKVKVIRQFCSVMEVRGPGRHLSGNENYPWREERESVLTGYDVSSLVVDRLCDQSRAQNTAVTCFYLDFAARKEQSVANILGSLLRQVVSGMDKVPEEITHVF